MKLIEIPNILPVHRFFEKKEDKKGFNDLIRPYIKRHTEALLLNTFELIDIFGIKINIRERFGFNTNILFLDSGGFLSLRDNSIVEEGDIGHILKWNDITIIPTDITACQEVNADIGVSLDFIPHSSLDQYEKEYRQKASLENAKIALDTKKNENLKLFAPIQGWDIESIRFSAKELSNYDFDGYGLGGMVPYANKPQYIAKAVKTTRAVIPKDKPLHVFGISSPILLPILFSGGVDTVDSATYAISAANRQYLLPNFLRHIDIRRLKNLPCSCGICTDTNVNYLLGGGARPTSILAMHNLNVIFDQLRLIRCLKHLNKLEEYAAVLASSAPEYMEAFKILIGKKPKVSYEDFDFRQFTVFDFQ